MGSVVGDGRGRSARMVVGRGDGVVGRRLSVVGKSTTRVRAGALARLP
jgi:hypothetical protein